MGRLLAKDDAVRAGGTGGAAKHQGGAEMWLLICLLFKDPAGKLFKEARLTVCFIFS